MDLAKDFTPEPEYDFVVIGGGPAGATFSTVVAKEGGHSVLVLEGSKFPRFTVGEIIAPTAIWRVWNRLGLTKETLDDLFIRKWNGGWIAPSRECFSFDQDVFPGDHRCEAYVYSFERSIYDDFLLNYARDNGVTALEEAWVEDVLFDENGRMNGVRFTRHGVSHEVKCKMVVDASGRVNYLGKKLGLRQEIAKLKSFAVFAHWEGAQREEGKAEGDVRIIYGKDMWCWWAPLKGDRTSVGVVANRDIFWDEYCEIGSEAFYDKYVVKNWFVGERLENAKRVTNFKPAPKPGSEGADYAGYHYYSAELVGDGWAMVGDAGGFIDPIFSAGLHISQTAGEKLADVCLAGMKDGDLSKERLQRDYEEWYIREFKEVLSHIQAFAELYFDERFVNLFVRLGNARERIRRMYIDTFIAFDKDAIIEYSKFLKTKFKFNQDSFAEEREAKKQEMAGADAS
ncbi:MAG: NAD(P)/FAD-dependent oxidoreductase [Phycisphaerales bacterium]